MSNAAKNTDAATLKIALSHLTARLDTLLLCQNVGGAPDLLGAIDQCRKDIADAKIAVDFLP